MFILKSTLTLYYHTSESHILEIRLLETHMSEIHSQVGHLKQNFEIDIIELHAIF